jgi:hypothetical protein
MGPMMRRSVLVVCLGFAGACQREREQRPPSPDPPAPVAVRVSAEQFRALAWLDGRWRGTMPDGKPFFEGYRMLNDSTVRSYDYPDSTAVVPSDSGAISLRGGELVTGSGGREWVATELGEGFARFEPRRGAKNSFTWQRTGPDAWTATLRWAAEAPVRETVYSMVRQSTPGSQSR